jgi:hypothetical protein
MNIPKEILQKVLYEDYEDGDITFDVDLKRSMDYAKDKHIIDYELTIHEDELKRATIWTETHVHILVRMGFAGEKMFICEKRNPPNFEYKKTLCKIRKFINNVINL